jgi:hypothetical protein
MKNDRTPAHLSVVGRLPEGYVILCRLDREEHSFLAKALGISVECPYCGATRCSAELAQEYYVGKSLTARSTGGRSGPVRSPHVQIIPR